MAAYHHSEKKIMKISKMSAMAMKYRRKKKIISKLRKIDINIIMAIINGGSRKCGGENRKKWRKWRESMAHQRQRGGGNQAKAIMAAAENGFSLEEMALGANRGVMKIISMAKARKYNEIAAISNGNGGEMAALAKSCRLSAKMAAAAQRNGWRHLWRGGISGESGVSGENRNGENNIWHESASPMATKTSA
jgi:hypothetical protein